MAAERQLWRAAPVSGISFGPWATPSQYIPGRLLSTVDGKEITVCALFQMEQLSEISSTLAGQHPHSQYDQIGFYFDLFTYRYLQPGRRHDRRAC